MKRQGVFGDAAHLWPVAGQCDTDAALRRMAEAITWRCEGGLHPVTPLEPLIDFYLGILRHELGDVLRDAERLNKLERLANKPGGILLHDGSETGRTGLGLRPGCLVRTLREAIDQGGA
jgi:hypothetical protein